VPTFRERFATIFGRPFPQPLTRGATESEWFAISDPDAFEERLVELFGWSLLHKLPVERFFCAGLQEIAGAGTGTLFLLEKRPGLTLWFRQEYRSPFSTVVSPAACLEDLTSVLRQAKEMEDLGGGSITFNKGSLTVRERPTNPGFMR